MRRTAIHTIGLMVAMAVLSANAAEPFSLADLSQWRTPRGQWQAAGFFVATMHGERETAPHGSARSVREMLTRSYS